MEQNFRPPYTTRLREKTKSFERKENTRMEQGDPTTGQLNRYTKRKSLNS